MHAVARLVLDPVIANIQASWVKMGPDGAALLPRRRLQRPRRRADERIHHARRRRHARPGDVRRRAGAPDPRRGRKPRQRTTLYGPVRPSAPAGCHPGTSRCRSVPGTQAHECRRGTRSRGYVATAGMTTRSCTKNRTIGTLRQGTRVRSRDGKRANSGPFDFPTRVRTPRAGPGRGAAEGQGRALADLRRAGRAGRIPKEVRAGSAGSAPTMPIPLNLYRVHWFNDRSGRPRSPRPCTSSCPRR